MDFGASIRRGPVVWTMVASLVCASFVCGGALGCNEVLGLKASSVENDANTTEVDASPLNVGPPRAPDVPTNVHETPDDEPSVDAGRLDKSTGAEPHDDIADAAQAIVDLDAATMTDGVAQADVASATDGGGRHCLGHHCPCVDGYLPPRDTVRAGADGGSDDAGGAERAFDVDSAQDDCLSEP